jgi:hypothetical protein
MCFLKYLDEKLRNRLAFSFLGIGDYDKNKKAVQGGLVFTLLLKIGRLAKTMTASFGIIITIPIKFVYMSGIN